LIKLLQKSSTSRFCGPYSRADRERWKRTHLGRGSCNHGTSYSRSSLSCSRN